MAAGISYTPLATTTLGSAASSVTFSSISGSYTDLVLVVSGTATTTANHTIRFNSDTGSNYSNTDIYGDGSSAGSERRSNDSNGIFIGNGNTSQYVKIVNVQNYSNTTTYKTLLARNSISAAAVSAHVGLWRSTSAITSISYIASTGNLESGLTATLYGITAA